MDCNVYNHIIECACPPGYIGDTKAGCVKCKNQLIDIFNNRFDTIK